MTTSISSEAFEKKPRKQKNKREYKNKNDNIHRNEVQKSNTEFENYRTILTNMPKLMKDR